MRRNLLLAALSGLGMYFTYRWGIGLMIDTRSTAVGAALDLSVISSGLVVGVALAWIAISTAERLGIVTEMVSDARARRAKQRRWRDRVARTRGLVNGQGEIRTGSGPARPDAVVDRAA